MVITSRIGSDHYLKLKDTVMKALTESILAVVVCSTLVSAPTEASSHREAPISVASRL